VFDETRGAALRGSFLIDRAGTVRWSVVNTMGQPRTLSDYRAVLGDLVG
jgi:alkyl hydroperoxide reductase subunit AhpC